MCATHPDGHVLQTAPSDSNRNPGHGPFQHGPSRPARSRLCQPQPATRRRTRQSAALYSGVWLGVGLAAFWLLPRIEKETALFRALWLMMFIGGVGRLISLMIEGTPFVPFTGFTAPEIIGAPRFVLGSTRGASG
jgi:hypothetical protein